MIKYQFTFPNTETAFKISDEIFAKVIDTIDADVFERQRIKLIVSELFMNAYVHGNDADPSKSIDVQLEFEKDSFTAIVKDQGEGITKDRFHEMVQSISDPEDESGRGITIVHRLSDKVQLYRDKDDKFCVKATKKIITQQPEPAKSRSGKRRKMEAV